MSAKMLSSEMLIFTGAPCPLKAFDSNDGCQFAPILPPIFWWKERDKKATTYLNETLASE